MTAGAVSAEVGVTGVACVAEDGVKVAVRAGPDALAARTPAAAVTVAATVTVPVATVTAFLKLISSMRE